MDQIIISEIELYKEVEIIKKNSVFTTLQIRN